MVMNALSKKGSSARQRLRWGVDAAGLVNSVFKRAPQASGKVRHRGSPRNTVGTEYRTGAEAGGENVVGQKPWGGLSCPASSLKRSSELGKLEARMLGFSKESAAKRD